jgi:isopentenyl diphosphate isomerase/L-lactate dehydrogenase-like FMN-dependent dehydrogenase
MKNTRLQGTETSIDAFFAGYAESRPIFDALLRLMNEIGLAEMRVTKSQIALRRIKAFAWIWVPGKHLRGKIAPLVLTVNFPAPDPSPRWKEIVEPARGRFMHHLELYSTQDLDAEVTAWLRKAWLAAE